MHTRSHNNYYEKRKIFEWSWRMRKRYIPGQREDQIETWKHSLNARLFHLDNWEGKWTKRNDGFGLLWIPWLGSRKRNFKKKRGVTIFSSRKFTFSNWRHASMHDLFTRKQNDSWRRETQIHFSLNNSTTKQIKR